MNFIGSERREGHVVERLTMDGQNSRSELVAILAAVERAPSFSTTRCLTCRKWKDDKPLL